MRLVEHSWYRLVVEMGRPLSHRAAWHGFLRHSSPHHRPAAVKVAVRSGRGSDAEMLRIVAAEALLALSAAAVVVRDQPLLPLLLSLTLPPSSWTG